MPRPHGRLLSALLLSIGALTAAALPACAVDSDGEDEATADSDFTEGSAEAKAILTLVNDRAVTADELVTGAQITRPAAANIVTRRDASEIRTLRELDAVPEVGPATIKKLFEFAKKKGLFGAAGGKVEAIFSPQVWESSHLARIVRDIESAEKTLDIAMYSYSDAKIGAALDAAVDRGVKVRFIFQDGGIDQRSGDLAARAGTKSGKLEAAGVDVRYVNKINHHKFMIVDGPRSSATAAKTAKIVSGSANWSNSAATRFDENTLFISESEELALRYQREFDLLWEHTRDFEGTSPAIAQDHSTLDITDALVTDKPNEHVFFTSQNFTVRDTTFSSTGANTVADALVAGINGATQSIHVASGHIRSRPVAEALIAKKLANPQLDVRVYLDSQEYISKTTHDMQIDALEACLANATTEARKRDCTDRGFLFGYQVASEGSIDVRYKYYAYRWDHSYAPQMHHKYMVIDGKELFTGSYNLSDNAEHGTFENMNVFKGAENAALVASFEANFEAIWKTGKDDDKLAALQQKIATQPTIPIVFEPMALTHAEITDLKSKIRTACPAVDSTAFRQNAASHQNCTR
jgi:phosphatidylserine/phosphatidylglycerophosphate/cardiolipin synthase-like enzyme